MNLKSLIVFLCITSATFGWSPGGRAGEPAASETIRIAAVDTPGGPPPCGKDGICNIAVCPTDPDCDLSELPDRPDPPTNRFPTRTSDVIDCSSKQTSEISAAVDWGAENWEHFKVALEKIRGWPVTIGNCLEARFQDNGKVVCESRSGGSCTTKGVLNNGFASPANKRCHMCPAFLDKVASLPDPPTNRQACYFALVTHEWGHTCERGHKTLEIIDDEALEFFKSRHPEVTITLGDCRMG